MTTSEAPDARARILYVDGDDDAARPIGFALQSCGEVQRCRTLGEADAALREGVPSLCVLDPDAPGGDGLALLATLRAREPWLQVLVICGSKHATSTSTFIAAGANDVAVKPFDVGALPNRVARLLRASARARDAHRERVALEHKLRHADRLASLGVMCATVAHELAGPLQVINLNGGLLAEAGADGQEAIDVGLAREVGRELLMAGSVIDAMIGRIRSFSRPNEERRVDVALDEVLDTALLLLRPRIVERKARIQRPQEPGPRASLFATRFAQAVINVVANAIETRDAGAEVAIRFVERGAQVGVEVIDDGPGMPDSVREDTAGVFFTTKPDGTGLGLPLVRRVLLEHEGALEIRPRDDGRAGTSVSLLVPRAGGG
jgi:signal transduction histidine kinase